jgi:RNA polymerase sigma-70 factor (ECF subfamily)
MPDTNHNEASLVEQAINGNVDAFGKLYSLHLDSIFRYIYFRIGDGEDAEDLTEQVFLKAWEALPRYQNQGSPLTSWLYKIAHNTVIDYYRFNKNTPVSVEQIITEEINPDEKSTLQEVIEREEAEVLVEAILRLAEEQQQVIILRFIEGLNHREVAEVLGKNEGACRMIQYRALLALQNILSSTEKF